ncbi:NAD(P)-binding protein [Auricularia subglabra TFB-10046 SS5]|uniref:NAD(P)-binding protein n=1 Tax=Auricularia subglabra (strain TFB-10046 / SS5) TaxID=717982 RepID=J0WWI0_AURST|nr:NAD(P)-binding protein [Auricularia subglabra TFB-10046 SS5]
MADAETKPALRVLLTGASGFIAAHILKQLLEAGYWVRATVRSESKKQDILKLYSEYESQLDFAFVQDVAEPGAFDEAVKAEPGLDYIVHTASPFHFHPDDPVKDIIEPAIQGYLSIVQAAQKNAPSVKRIVFTGSLSSVADCAILPGPAGKAFKEEDWNPVTLEVAKSNPMMAYFGSKTLSEKALWEWIEKEQPSFDIVVLNIAFVFGPLANVQTLASLNTSIQGLYSVFSGTCGQEVPPTWAHVWVDVRDTARAHLLALAAPKEAGNQRYCIAADGICSNQEAADIWRRRFPEYADRIPVGKPGTGFGMEPGTYATCDNSKSKKVLGLQYQHDYEGMLVDLAKDFIQLEKNGA